MALKIEVYHKEKVRPFSPTPGTLRYYKLSLLDIIAGTFYTPLVFFYGSGDDHRRHDYDELKESLSKTLAVLYPLAGRLKDGSTIECNDEGADFVRANVTNCNLAEILRHTELENLRQLLPLDPYPNAIDPAQPMLAVQVNRFRCGGTAVALCVWHAVADAAGIAGIFNTWAAINRGEGAPANSSALIADPTKIFKTAKIDNSLIMSPAVEVRTKNRGKYSSKRFIFDKQAIERIREDYNQSDHHRPSRVEALTGFIWAAVIRAIVLVNPNLKMHLLTNVVNLRNKLIPPFPSQCLGNINQVTGAWWGAGEQAGIITGRSLVGRVVEAINKVTDNYVRKMHAEGGYLKAISAHISKATYNRDEFKVLSISSLCNITFSQVDFGWGKPIWIGLGHTLEDLAIFMDTKDGGVEVWIGLEHQVMSNLYKDMKFHAYVSFSEIVSKPSNSLWSSL